MRRPTTLTFRLTVMFTLVSAAVLLGLGVLVAMATNKHFTELDRNYLEDKLQLLERIVGESVGIDDLARRLHAVQNSHQGLFLRLERDGAPIFKSAAIDFPAELRSDPALAQVSEWQTGPLSLRGMGREIEVHNPLLGPAFEGRRLRIDVAIDTAIHAHFMTELRLKLLLYLVLAMIVSAHLGWWVVRSGLAPLRIMKNRAKDVSAHKLDQRMPIEAVPVELADLAHSLNAMLDRLQADFQRLMEFSSDLAHELRTPIGNLLTQTQVSLAHPRQAEMYREILASNAEEFQRLARMISDMLYLAKTENDIELPHPEKVELGQEIRALFDFYDALADEKQVRLILGGAASVWGDKLMVRRAIGNLLSNAIRHALPGSDVTVSVAELDGEVRVCVANLGPTIDAAHIPRLFDRFYRVDKSRMHSEAEGTGLGLAITRAIMLAHRGAVSVTSGLGKTEFCLVFPREAAAHG